MIYAHRGASFELPENTLESFALALSLGADAIETDAHLTRDGRVVLAHDPDGERVTGVARRLSDLTWTELREWDVGRRFVPRRPGAFRDSQHYRMTLLEDALAAFPGVFFNVDAKQTAPDMIPALLRSIRRVSAEDRVRIASFSSSNLQRARALGWTGESGLASKEIARIFLVPWAALRWMRVEGQVAQVPRKAYGVSFANQAAIARFHAVGLRVDFWTIDDPEEARALFAMGAHGVMTDDPRTLCAALRPARSL